ncbi:hypothetical protein LY76DRAFT_368030 [Colletotrichum caudatum]|nr:hypothetical protein LY76DRAFT_368030 [Colletotrichum caudatum]
MRMRMRHCLSSYCAVGSCSRGRSPSAFSHLSTAVQEEELNSSPHPPIRIAISLLRTDHPHRMRWLKKFSNPLCSKLCMPGMLVPVFE